MRYRLKSSTNLNQKTSGSAKNLTRGNKDVCEKVAAIDTRMKQLDRTIPFALLYPDQLTLMSLYLKPIVTLTIYLITPIKVVA